MMLQWLVQDTSRSFGSAESDLTPLSNINADIHTFGVLPFTNELMFTDINKLNTTMPLMVRCSVKILKLLSTCSASNVDSEMQKYLKSGISYNHTNFDQRYYSTLGLPLLNSKATFHKFKDIKNQMFSDDMFIKPSSDLKAFDAGVLYSGQMVREHVENSYVSPDVDNEIVLVSPCVKILSEYRFICFNGDVLSGSQYRNEYELHLCSDIPGDVLEAAKKYATLYKPSDLYAMDLAVTPNGIKIIEYNCWNCSGLYAINTEELFQKIQQYKTINLQIN